mmetsp:Transcript_8231/g.12646  ORF Transcript_8231/g.12646 Transcript_8231/m.12646 type:complete len:324 (+) Transcript_8231:58-1029(+)
MFAPTVLRCDPKLFEKDLTDQVIIVTGANSGIGLETARQLAKQHATVIMACRNEEKAKAAMDDITLSCSSAKLVFLPLDLSSLENVREFVKSFTSQYTRLDILIANAGIMMCPYSKTKDGFESQMGCNHLAHFLLLQLLIPTLLKTADTTNKPSRFIAVSSVAAASTTAMGQGSIDFDDLLWETRKYDAGKAYGQSKLANYLTAYEASQKYDSSKLISVSLHPGWVRSNLDVHVLSSGFVGNAIRNLVQWMGHMIGPVDGAQTTLHCALEDDIQSGGWYSQFGIYKNKSAKAGGWPLPKMPNANATPEAASKLWNMSEELVNS